MVQPPAGGEPCRGLPGRNDREMTKKDGDTLWCHQTWLENPSKNRGLNGKITEKWWIFQLATFD